MTAALSALRDLICDALDKAPEPLPRVPDLLEFVTSKEWAAFGQASPVQRALVMAWDGMEVSTKTTGLTESELRFHFGLPFLPEGPRPKTAVGNAGVRAGKTLLSAIVSLLHGSLTCDVSIMRKGERARGLIVAPRMKQAEKAFEHVVESVRHSPTMFRMLVKEPTVSQMMLRRHDGFEVLIEIVAAAKGGRNLRSTWLTGVVFDEADFHDEEDAAVNLDDNRNAVLPRMLRGAQEHVISSPWADTGPFYTLHQRYFGKPSVGVLAWHSDSHSMNPALDVDAEEQMRAIDPDKHAREYLAIPTSAGNEDFFTASAVASALAVEVSCTPMATEGDPFSRALVL